MFQSEKMPEPILEDNNLKLVPRSINRLGLPNKSDVVVDKLARRIMFIQVSIHECLQNAEKISKNREYEVRLQRKISIGNYRSLLKPGPSEDLSDILTRTAIMGKITRNFIPSRSGTSIYSPLKECKVVRACCPFML